MFLTVHAHIVTPTPAEPFLGFSSDFHRESNGRDERTPGLVAAPRKNAELNIRGLATGTEGYAVATYDWQQSAL